MTTQILNFFSIFKALKKRIVGLHMKQAICTTQINISRPVKSLIYQLFSLTIISNLFGREKNGALKIEINHKAVFPNKMQLIIKEAAATLTRLRSFSCLHAIHTCRRATACSPSNSCTNSSRHESAATPSSPDKKPTQRITTIVNNADVHRMRRKVKVMFHKEHLIYRNVWSNIYRQPRWDAWEERPRNIWWRKRSVENRVSPPVKKENIYFRLLHAAGWHLWKLRKQAWSLVCGVGTQQERRCSAVGGKRGGCGVRGMVSVKNLRILATCCFWKHRRQREGSTLLFPFANNEGISEGSRPPWQRIWRASHRVDLTLFLLNCKTKTGAHIRKLLHGSRLGTGFCLAFSPVWPWQKTRHTGTTRKTTTTWKSAAFLSLNFKDKM